MVFQLKYSGYCEYLEAFSSKSQRFSFHRSHVPYGSYLKCACKCSCGRGGDIALEIYVVYNTSYQVPDLLISARYAGGEPLSLEDFVVCCSNLAHSDRGFLESFIVITENPVTSQACFRIQPCTTLSVLGILFPDFPCDGNRNVIESWFNSVINILGLPELTEMNQHLISTCADDKSLL